MSVEVVIHDNLQLLALSLGELQMEGDLGHSARDHLQDQGWHHVRQGEDSKHKEVGGQKHVDILFAEYLKNCVESSEGSAMKKF